jgi:nucleoside-diphosphate-sugar epimerase
VISSKNGGSEMKKVLVVGATGYLGQYIIKEFRKQGYWVRALSGIGVLTQRKEEGRDFLCGLTLITININYPNQF